MNDKKVLIKNYITKEECNYMCDDRLFDCESCGCFEECYSKSCERCNNEFVVCIDNGGYDTAEDFWGQI